MIVNPQVTPIWDKLCGNFEKLSKTVVFENSRVYLEIFNPRIFAFGEFLLAIFELLHVIFNVKF